MDFLGQGGTVDHPQSALFDAAEIAGIADKTRQFELLFDDVQAAPAPRLQPQKTL